VTITYEENGKTVSSTVEVEMLAPETEAPTQPPTDAPTEPQTEPATEVPTQPSATEPAPDKDSDSGKLWIFPVAILVALLIAEYFIVKRLVKIRKLRKAAKAAAEEEHTELPDDNSPLEYI